MLIPADFRNVLRHLIEGLVIASNECPNIGPDARANIYSLNVLQASIGTRTRPLCELSNVTRLSIENSSRYCKGIKAHYTNDAGGQRTHHRGEGLECLRLREAFGAALNLGMEDILKQSWVDSHHTDMADLESRSAIQPFCVWEQASRKFAIHLPAEVIGSLGTESLVAFKRVPRRGLETGGILLGRTESRDDTTTFFIEGFAPIECEHRFGPSYVLSDSDFTHLLTELAKNGAASIGIYRSQTRSEQLAIQEADFRLFETCFGVSDNLFLMLSPVSRVGAFYFREDGKLKCVHQFTVVSSLSSIAKQGRTSSPHVNLYPPPSTGTHGVHTNIARHSADRAGALVVSSQISDQEAPRKAALTTDWGNENMPPKNAGARRCSGTYGLWTTVTRRWATKLWNECSGRISGVKSRSGVLAAFALAVLTVSLLSYSFRRSAAPDHRAPNYLYLAVERAGPALRLHWDGNSSAVRGASSAVLHIQDGDQQSDRELAPSEFMAGQFTYQPQHSAVTFRLNVYAGEPNAIGLIQVMSPLSPITAAPSIEPIPQLLQNSRLKVQLPVKPIARAEAPAAQSAPTWRQSNDTKDQNIEAQLTLVRSEDASKIGPPAAREPDLPAGFEDSRQHPPIAERNDISTPGQELNVRVVTTPAPSSRLGRLYGRIPLVGRLWKQAQAVEAVPVYQAQPIVRMPNNQQLVRPVSVGVKVYVGESGAVNDAEVIDYGDPLNLRLANAALAAARNWTFVPSRVDDIPVASRVIIHFYFSP